jgi:hypothetical protein
VGGEKLGHAYCISGKQVSRYRQLGGLRPMQIIVAQEAVRGAGLIAVCKAVRTPSLRPTFNDTNRPTMISPVGASPQGQYPYPPSSYNNSSNTFMKAPDNVPRISRTPSPTPSEEAELTRTSFLDWKSLSNWRYWFRREWLCAFWVAVSFAFSWC